MASNRDESLKLIEQYEEVKMKDPANFENIFNLALEYSKIDETIMSKENYELFLECFGNIKAANRFTGAVYNNLAICYGKLHINRSKILPYHILAYSFAKTSEIITKNLALEYTIHGKRQDAIDIYEILSKQKPDNIEYIHKQIDLYFEIYEIRRTPKVTKDECLEKATELLKLLYNSAEYQSEFKKNYPEEAYLVSEILKLQECNDEPRVYLFLSKIFQHINSIKKRLRMNLDENVEIAHYTTLEILKILVGENSKFRISNATYLNDPTEGEVFQKCLEDLWEKDILLDNINNNQEKIENNKLDINNTYIASFSMKPDYLPMWVQYGNDAKGCSIVFSNSIFDEDDLPYLLNGTEGNSDSRVIQTINSEDTPPYCLYKIQYICEDASNLDTIIKEHLIDIGKLLNNCKYNLLDDGIQIIFSFTKTLFEQIRYLFKSDSYKHEEEMRVVLFSHIENASVEDFIREGSIFPRVYVELDKELKFDKIILGSKVIKSNEYVPYLIKSGKVKSVYNSKIKYK